MDDREKLMANAKAYSDSVGAMVERMKARAREQQMEAEMLAYEKVPRIQREMSDDEPLKRIQREIEAMTATQMLRDDVLQAMASDSTLTATQRDEYRRWQQDQARYDAKCDQVDVTVNTIEGQAVKTFRIRRPEPYVTADDPVLYGGTSRAYDIAQRKAFEDQALYGTGVVSQAMAADGSWYAAVPPITDITQYMAGDAPSYTDITRSISEYVKTHYPINDSTEQPANEITGTLPTGAAITTGTIAAGPLLYTGAAGPLLYTGEIGTVDSGFTFVPRDFNRQGDSNTLKLYVGGKPVDAIQQLRDLRDTQRSSCDCVGDSYFRGLYNGMELALSTLENREPQYIGPPALAPFDPDSPGEQVFVTVDDDASVEALRHNTSFVSVHRYNRRQAVVGEIGCLVHADGGLLCRLLHRVPQRTEPESVDPYGDLLNDPQFMPEVLQTKAVNVVGPADPEPTPGVLPANRNLLRWK